MYLIALSSIALSVAGQFALKAGVSTSRAREAVLGGFSPRGVFAILTEPYVALGFLLYALGAVVWLAVLSRWDVSKAYPLTGLGFALAVGIGMAAGESVNIWRIAGVGLVCVGVVLIGRS